MTHSFDSHDKQHPAPVNIDFTRCRDTEDAHRLAVVQVIASAQLRVCSGLLLVMMPTWLLAVLGLVLSVYAVYVEHKVNRAHEDPSLDFTALCDIEAIGASCRYEWLLGNVMSCVPFEDSLMGISCVLTALFSNDQRASSCRTLGLSLKATRLMWQMRFLGHCTT